MRVNLYKKWQARASTPKPMEGELEKEEKAHLQTIDERDAAQEAISEAYCLVTGNSPEWSNLFGYKEALEEIEEKLRPAKPADNIGELLEMVEDIQVKLGGIGLTNMSLNPNTRRKITKITDEGLTIAKKLYAALSLPATTRAVGEWHPMGTAPKDGREILCWMSSDTFQDQVATLEWDILQEAWVYSDTLGLVRRQDLLNGWQPYPEPPAPPTQSQKGE